MAGCRRNDRPDTPEYASGPRDPENCLDKPARVRAGATGVAFPAKAVRCDDSPLGVGQNCADQGCSPLFATLNQSSADLGIPKRQQALVLLGRSARHGAKDYFTNIQNVLDQKMEYRRNGSAAYSLLSVAAGRAEGYYEAHLNSWDALAGRCCTDVNPGAILDHGIGRMI